MPRKDFKLPEIYMNSMGYKHTLAILVTIDQSLFSAVAALDSISYNKSSPEGDQE
jgi:hypothetical protein